MNKREEDDNMILEFKAVLFFILDLLEHGETERAIKQIKNILNSSK